METDRKLPTMPLPKAGDPINEALMQGLTERVNAANEASDDRPSSHIRWAVTCNDPDGNYPEHSAKSIAYPFRWFGTVPASGAAAGTDVPIRDITTTLDTFERYEPLESDSEVDGYAVNVAEFERSRGGNHNDYLQIGTVCLVGFSQGTYYLARPSVDKYMFVPTATIGVKVGGTYKSKPANAYCFRSTGTDEWALQQVLTDSGAAWQPPLINPSPFDEILTTDTVGGEYFAGGVFIATVWPCE